MRSPWRRAYEGFLGRARRSKVGRGPSHVSRPDRRAARLTATRCSWRRLAASPCSPPARLAATARTSMPAIERQVMCVTCKIPLNVAESPQSQRERAYIRGLIAEGKTEARSRANSSASTGSSVLALPSAKGFDLAAYLVPVAVVLALIGLLALLLPSWRRHARAQAATGASSPSSAPAMPRAWTRTSSGSTDKIDFARRWVSESSWLVPLATPAATSPPAHPALDTPAGYISTGASSARYTRRLHLHWHVQRSLHPPATSPPARPLPSSSASWRSSDVRLRTAPGAGIRAPATRRRAHDSRGRKP